MTFATLPIGCYFRTMFGCTVYLKVSSTHVQIGNSVVRYPLDQLVTPLPHG